MYFSKSEFIPDDKVAEMTQRAAQRAIQIGTEDFGIHLDGTGDSIRGLDEILDRMRRSQLPEEEAQRLGRVFGSYFGEILRQAHGAIWGVGAGI